MNDAEMFSEPRALAAGSVQQLKLKLSRLRRLNDADRWEIRVITGVCGRLPALEQDPRALELHGVLVLTSEMTPTCRFIVWKYISYPMTDR